MAINITAGFVSQYSNLGRDFITTTWANRPANPQDYTGIIIQVSDVGLGGSLFISNGTLWVPVATVVLARSAVAIANSSSTNGAEFNFAPVTIPAGLMGLNGTIEVEALYTFTGSTNSKSAIIRHSTVSADGTGTAIINSATTTAGDVSFRAKSALHNRNLANSQVLPATAHLVSGFSSGAKQAPTIDTAAVSYINFNGNKALGSETETLEWYEVRLIP
jgi:hypothetical protein